MEKLFIYTLFIFLTSCTHNQTVITDKEPLNDTLDALKQELAAFKYGLKKYKYKFECANNPSVNASEVMNIEKIKVTISIASAESIGGQAGVIMNVVALSGSGSSELKKSNKLELNLRPQEIPDNDDIAYQKKLKGGIADSLLSIVEGYADTNDKAPCLIGTSSKFTLGFNAAEKNDGSAGVDLIVFKAGVKGQNVETYSNELAIDFNFSDAATL